MSHWAASCSVCTYMYVAVYTQCDMVLAPNGWNGKAGNILGLGPFYEWQSLGLLFMATGMYMLLQKVAP